jgi:16S rRNA (cytidine1402-2'-O)-methyltransferase
METPYRNNQLFETILKTCNNNTKLCIASDITLPSEKIKTKTISEWKQTKINIYKKPAIFLIG